MWIDGLYVPNLIADEVMASQYSQGGSVQIHQVQPGATSTTAATTTSDPSNATLTVLWVGVITSIAGLALQTMRFMAETKEK